MERFEAEAAIKRQKAKATNHSDVGRQLRNHKGLLNHLGSVGLQMKQKRWNWPNLVMPMAEDGMMLVSELKVLPSGGSTLRNLSG